MLKRILVSAVILPLFIGLMFFEPAVYFRLFLAICVFMGFIEYRGLMQQKGLLINPWPGVMALFVVLFPVVLQGLVPVRSMHEPGGALTVMQGLAALFIVLGVGIITQPDTERGPLRFFAEITGPLYLGVLGLHVLLLHHLEQGSWWVLLCFWYAWMYDAGALFIGKPFGRRKFSELSPNKTWEGFWGGIAINALLSGLVLPWIFPKTFPLNWAMFAAASVPASLLAQAGDLFESMLKRFAGVKDSSQLIAAHGGFLDKMDSTIFVAPFLYMLATLLGAR